MSYLCADRFSAYNGLTVAAVASTAAGPAPQAVFFDATGTTDTSTSRPFHDLFYAWSFGDSGAGTFTAGRTSGLSKNVAYGPVAAHVYTNAGTFTPVLTVFNGKAWKVLVLPDVVITAADSYAGWTTTKTYACANGSTPVAGVDGVPAGATISALNAGDFDAEIAAALAASCKRILFKHDDAWTASTSSPVAAAGPGLIGQYGTGAAPAITASADQTMLRFQSTSDWRVMDLALDGGLTTGTTAISTNGSTVSDITVLRVTVENCLQGTGGGISHLTWQEGSITTGTGNAYGLFTGAAPYLALLGNTIDIGGTSSGHTVRVPSAAPFVISANTLTANLTGACLTIHGPTYVADNYTENGIVSDNYFIGSASAGMVVMDPQASTFDERLRNIIFERNRGLAGSGSGNMLRVEAVGVTSRNNVAIVTGAAIHQMFLVEYASTVNAPRPDLCNFYNNSVYNADADSNTRMFRLASTLNSETRIDIQNNVGYAPAATTPVLILSDGTATVTGASGTFGNASDTQIKNTSPFTDTTPSDPANGDFDPANYAVAGGVVIAIYDDQLSDIRFYGNVAPSIDAGAVQTTVN